MTRARYPDEEGRARNEEVELHYEVCGDGETTVLLLPSWQVVHSRAWKAQVPFLSRHYRVLTYDARGNGKSDRPRGPENYGYDRLVADAWAVMDASRTDQAVVMGCSLAGHLAALMAAERPERISGAVLISPASPFGPAMNTATSTRGGATPMTAGIATTPTWRENTVAAEWFNGFASTALHQAGGGHGRLTLAAGDDDRARCGRPHGAATRTRFAASGVPCCSCMATAISTSRWRRPAIWPRYNGRVQICRGRPMSPRPASRPRST
jgi:pimeloyl-ACP methyl ester carboxylesterase